MNAEGLPANALVALAQHAKKNLPEDLDAVGEVRGSATMRRDGTAEAPEFSGSGEVTHLHVRSASSKAEVEAGTVPFVLATANLEKGLPLPMARPAAPRRTDARLAVLQFGPFSLGQAQASGRGAPPTVRGWFDLSEYGMTVIGDADVARTLRMAKLAGFPAIASTAEGQAQIDLQIAGTWHSWMGGAPSEVFTPQVLGTAKLHNVRAQLRGVDSPFEVAAANVQLSPNEVRVTKVNATAAHALWTGSLTLPRGCGAPGACTVSFDLTTNQLGLSDVAQWITPRAKPVPWYRLSAVKDAGGPGFFASLKADGKVTVSHLLLRGVTANHVSAEVSLDAGKLLVSDVRGELLGGTHRGEWRGDFTVSARIWLHV